MDYPRNSCRVYLSELFGRCVLTRQIVFSAAMIEYPNGLHLETEKLFLPMVGTDGEVEKVLTLFTFDFGTASMIEPDELSEPDCVREQYSLYPSLVALENAIDHASGLQPVIPRPVRVFV
jgi:hypothetical protein